MRSKILASLTLSFALGASACSSDTVATDVGFPDTGVLPDTCTDSEPCPLTPGTMSAEKITPVGDTDRFTFNVASASQIINVVVSNDAAFSPIRLEVVLFGPDGASLGNQRFQMNGRQRVELQVVAPAAGAYAVVVRDVGNDGADNSNPYFVVVNVISETDNNEPNETLATAKPLTPGTPITGNIGFQADLDWFEIAVTANSLLQIEVSAPGAPTVVRLKWELYDETGNTRIAESLEPVEDVAWPLENRAVGNTAGTYHLKIFDYPDDGMAADPSRPYTLTVRLVPEVDVQDLAAPNETFATATLVTGQQVTGYIAATSDVDFYKITVRNPPRIIRVVSSMGASDVDLSFTVLSRDGETPICETEDEDVGCRAFRFVPDGTGSATTLTTAHVARNNGDYYVMVRDFQDNDFDTTTPYTVTIDLPNDPDTNENYGPRDRSSAVPIAASSSTAGQIQWPWVTGFLSYVNDEDWYSFQVPGAGGVWNGDWMVNLEIQVPGPTPVETKTWLFASQNAPYPNYGSKGYACREATPQDPTPCQYPDGQNGINAKHGECADCNPMECFALFREQTNSGAHYIRMVDLDRDDFDLAPGGQYRFRLTVTPNCTLPGMCEGEFGAPQCMGSSSSLPNDCCGRP
ncbi:MAG: hypothetical protein IPG45_09855 [Deltaproteobacteria bacterium]|nr:hypothetical protein [Deltaproteobacteria bacterium]